MRQYFIARFLSIIPKLLVITMLIFFGLKLLPGDPLARMVNPDEMNGASLEQMEAKREELGLNDPVLVQYFRWLGNMFKGDFGYSLTSHSPVRKIIAARFPATLEICGLAMIFAAFFGLLMGCQCARHRNTALDYGNTVIGLIGSSFPGFFVAMCLIMLFSLKLKWLPTGGRMTVGETGLLARLKYMVLPSFCLGFSMIANVMRMTRDSMLDVMNRDYITTARAKGEKEGVIFAKHVFRNGCTPVILLLIGRFSLLVGGSTIIETVFNYPGMGMLMITSISASDYQVAMMVLLLAAVMVLLLSAVGDVIIALLDPRVRFGKA